MNQRIRELFTPELIEWGAENDDNFTEELEKFAELIVRECADWVSQSVVRDKGHIPQDPHSRGWNAAVAYASRELKQRFGVEQ